MKRLRTLPRVIDCRGRKLAIGTETAVMGILNLTPDSFSDGGQHPTLETAVEHAEHMVAEGAAIIDVGGQSTRPGFAEISEEEEIARVLPVIKALVSRLTVPLSIDTYKPGVARAALKAGAHVLNDVFGLQGEGGLAEIAAAYSAPVIAMHQQIEFPKAAGNTLEKLKLFFDDTVSIALDAGLGLERLVIDPGIGFHKTQGQNLEILGQLDEIRDWGLPVLLGVSRKSVIGNVLGLPAAERLEGTLATTALAAWHGVELVRVHDVGPNVRVARMVSAIRAASPS